MDLLRSAGGVLFAVGAVLVLARKSGHHGWGDFARLLVVLVPAVVLYVLALGGAESAGGSESVGGPEGVRDEHAHPWQSVLMVVAILLGPVVLLEFLAWVGANTGHVLYGAGVFAVTALLAGYGARRARVSYAALLAGLSLLLTWLLLWEKILGHPSANTYRWLLVAAAVLLFVFAARLARASAIGAGELATAGGIAAVMAGVLGVIIGSFVGAFSGLAGAFSKASETSSISSGSGSIGGSGSIIGLGAGKASVISRASGTIRGSVASRGSVIGRASGNIRGSIRGVSSRPHISRIPHVPHVSVNPHVPRTSPILRNPQILRSHHLSSNPFAIHTNGLQHFGWDLYLLVVSLALVWVGSRARVRGLGYVGGVGLLAFLISVGEQVTRLESGRAPTSHIVGWPLALLIIGLAGLAAPLLYRRETDAQPPRNLG
jgi:hypothetical protein